MIHHCPKCRTPVVVVTADGFNHFTSVRLIYQPSKRQYWCQKCNGTFTPAEAQVVGVFKEATK